MLLGRIAGPAAAGVGVSAQKIDFLKRQDLTACDIPTCRAHSEDHNAPWYTVRVILFEELHACIVLKIFRALPAKLGELCRGVAPAENGLLVPVLLCQERPGVGLALGRVRNCWPLDANRTLGQWMLAAR